MKNLTLLFEKTDKEGMNWYYDANIFAARVAEQNNLPLAVVAAVISALSPATNWLFVFLSAVVPKAVLV